MPPKRGKQRLHRSPVCRGLRFAFRTPQVVDYLAPLPPPPPPTKRAPLVAGCGGKTMPTCTWVWVARLVAWPCRHVLLPLLPHHCSTAQGGHPPNQFIHPNASIHPKQNTAARPPARNNPTMASTRIQFAPSPEKHRAGAPPSTLQEEEVTMVDDMKVRTGKVGACIYPSIRPSSSRPPHPHPT